MTVEELKTAMKGSPDGCNIVVSTRSGKRYWLHEDQLPNATAGGLIYGTPVIRSHRDRNSVRWFRLENINPARKER